MIARGLVATLAVSGPVSPASRRGRRLRRATRWVVAIALIAAALSCAAAGPPAALAQLPRPERQADYVPGEVIVKFRPGLSRAGRVDALRDRGAGLKRSLGAVRTVLAGLEPGQAVTSAVRRLERDPRVAWAEPNAYRYGGSLPGDPLLDAQWGLHNTGQSVDGTTGAAGADIDAPRAWERTTGSAAVKVAVVDSGINFGQPDLAENVWRNPGESGAGREHNGVDDDGNGFVDDWRGWDFVQQDNDPSDHYGHGTHVAGTIAARGDNGLGITGVAWRASVIPVRVLDNLNSGGCADTSAGMAYAVRAGARVVNMSLGTRRPCQAERDVIDSAPNTLFVVAAMNDGLDVDAGPVYPCAHPSPNVVCVAATDSSDRLAGFSNYGASSVDLAAPGATILSSYLRWGPPEILYSDDFEAPLSGRWITGGSPDTWVRTPFAGSRSGGWSLSNSVLGYYANGTDNWARLTQGLDLSGRRDCAARVWIRASLGAFDPAQPVDAQDRLVAEASPDGVRWGRRPELMVGSNTAFEQWLIDLSELEGRSTGGLRFRLLANAADTFGGVALDDLTVLCVPPLTSYTGAAEEFAFDSGTSMAAPHVSGVAVLMLSLDAGLSAGEVKQRLLRSVDPLPSLAGRVLTGGRLNAARALDPPAGAPPAGAAERPPAGSAAPPPSPSWALGIDLRAFARELRRRGLGAVLRRGGFRADRLHALAPGRFALEVRVRGGRTVARGSRSVRRPSVFALTARLTRGGRTLLRRAHRARLTLVLSFAPRTGGSLRRRLALTLRR